MPANAINPIDARDVAIAERWPLSAWTSLTARALHQAARLNDAAARSDGKLTVITTARDLTRYIDRRAPGLNIIAGLLGVEGGHALDGNLDNLDRLFAAGVRMMAPTHLADKIIAAAQQEKEAAHK